MIISKKKHQKIVKELEQEIDNLKKEKDTAIFMYEAVNKDEFKNIEQVKDGVIFVFVESRTRYRIVESSPGQFTLFRIFTDGSESPSNKFSSFTMTKEKLFEELTNYYIKIVEDPSSEESEK